MNVIIPFKDLDEDVQEALKTKCIREGKTLQQVGGEILQSVAKGHPVTHREESNQPAHLGDGV